MSQTPLSTNDSKEDRKEKRAYKPCGGRKKKPQTLKAICWPHHRMKFSSSHR